MPGCGVRHAGLGWLTAQLCDRHAVLAALATLPCCWLAAASALAADAVPAEVQARFHVAPGEAVEAPSERLLRIWVNDVDAGVQRVSMRAGQVVLPPAVAATLRLRAPATGLVLQATRDLSFTLTVATGELHIVASEASLLPLSIGVPGLADLRLSPEAWGAWLDYDINMRLGRGGLGGGGFAQLHATGPDFTGLSSWAFSAGQSGQGPVRLDNALTWRPANDELFATLGDGITPLSSGARSFRFGGMVVGTDHSAQPGFSTAPLLQVDGTARAMSTLDLVQDGRVVDSRATAGGSFSLNLPNGTATQLVLTDVTGRRVMLPIDAPRVDAGLLRSGLTLWSAGVGVPRFGFGAPDTTYEGGVYGFAALRHGLSPRVSLTGHLEGGPGIGEAEAGINLLASSRVALRGFAAGSSSAKGLGTRLGGAIIVNGPWNLSGEASFEQVLGGFEDVVSLTARHYEMAHSSRVARDLRHGDVPTRRATLRLSWRLSDDWSVTGVFDQQNRSDGQVSLLSASIQGRLGRVPVFANLAHGTGNGLGTSLLVGINIPLGDNAQSYVSAGTADSGLALAAGGARPLGEDVGSYGWRANSSRTGRTDFASGAIETRTGYGIPGLAFDTSGGTGNRQITGYGTLRGAVGYVAGHAFAADPVPPGGGIVVADAGAPGIPVQVNGAVRGRSGWDGRAALPVPVAGVPQVVSVGDDRLPLEQVATTTEQRVVVRLGGASRADFGVHDVTSGALVEVRVDGQVPPIGSMLTGVGASAPVGRTGRAYLPSLRPGEVLSLQMPDGRSCQVSTDFDGHGGPRRRIGPFECRAGGTP